MSRRTQQKIISTLAFFYAMWYVFHTKSIEGRLEFNETCKNPFTFFARNVVLFFISFLMIVGPKKLLATNSMDVALFLTVFNGLMGLMFGFLSMVTEAYCFNGIILFSTGLWALQQLQFYNDVQPLT